jgi:Asp-tRNA(Asn)/Glu-tRNA(Gln) amidotransferase A subunit family amidase
VTRDFLPGFTLAALSRAIQSRDVSPVEVTEACLARIDRLDRTLNAFITLTPDRALAAARRAEGEITAGRQRGRLHEAGAVILGTLNMSEFAYAAIHPDYTAAGRLPCSSTLLTVSGHRNYNVNVGL